ncbi:unnamed protein product, partial [Amoebophrya sp. A25]
RGPCFRPDAPSVAAGPQCVGACGPPPPCLCPPSKAKGLASWRVCRKNSKKTRGKAGAVGICSIQLERSAPSYRRRHRGILLSCHQPRM